MSAGRGVAGCVVALSVGLASSALLFSPVANAEPSTCDEPSCTPGIAAGTELGAPCTNTSHYVFGVTSWSRLVFCGSPRGLSPRYFRSPPMMGIREENTSCAGLETTVAQAPDGKFLACEVVDTVPLWQHGDR